MLNKILFITFILFTILSGCKKETVSFEKVEHPLFLCSQDDAVETSMPDGFKITPKQALDKAEQYYLSNPFMLMLYVDNEFYYVDIASFGVNAERAEKRGLKIDGGTGEVVRGEVRVIGK